MDEKFENAYKQAYALYRELIETNQATPMQVFGVFMGIIAQEFNEHSTKEEFDRYLKGMMEVDWNQETLQ